MPRQTSFQMTAATERQIDALKNIGFGSTTDIIRIAIDRMIQQEIQEITMSIVYDVDVNESGTVMNRVAKINGKFWPYRFDLNNAQVVRGRSFAGHTPDGIMYVSTPYDTVEKAIANL